MANQAGLGLSDKVHTQEINEYPDDWKEEYLQLNLWVKAFLRHYGPWVRLRLLDPQSLVGFWKSLRYRVWRYPAFILEGRERFIGWEAEPQLHQRLEELLQERGLPVPQRPFQVLQAPQWRLPGARQTAT